MNKIIYFAIQTKSRELDEKLLLSYYALKKGYEVIIGRSKYIEKTFLKNNYGIVYNRIQYANDNNVKKTLFVSHDDEGLVFNIETKTLRRNLDGLNYKPNIIITWGQIQKKLFLEDYPQLRDRIYSLGSPRFDLINKPYVTYFTHNTIKRINRFNDFVLINTNFSKFNLDSWHKLSIEEFANKYIEPKRSEVLKDYQFQKKIIPIYIRAIKKLAKERPNLNFILRPHPSENLTYWKNHFKRSDNIHVIYEYQSNDWINQAKLVIHTNCTTGIEATVLKKPVIRFLPKMKNSEVFNTASYFGIELD